MIRHLIRLIWNRKRKNALLTLEVFLSFLILFAALSAIIYHLDLYQEPKGFDHENLWFVNMYNPQYEDSLLTVTTKQTLRRDLKAMPEIENMSFISSNYPYSGNSSTYNSELDGKSLSSDYFRTDENFAKTAGLEIVEGRWFTEEDIFAKDKMAVISKSIADDLFKDTTAIGGTIPIQRAKVIGVVDHYKYRGEFSEEKNSTFVQSKLHEGYGGANMLIKLSPNTPPIFEKELSDMLKSTAKDWPFTIRQVDSMRTISNKKVWIPMIMLLAICIFLVLNVALGLFGVLWYNINHRKSEIGLRRALGASKGSVARQFVLEMVLLASIGILVGAFFAIQVPLLKMFDVENVVFIKAMVASGLFIYILVLICTIYPSAQASAIQPAIALHDE